jgi:DNA invertase Pin-like site-specific DNA recombinase
MGQEETQVQDYISVQDKKAARKAKEKARHENICLDDIDYLPPRVKPPDVFRDERTMRVAVYIRVSSDSENQVSSFVMQEKVYTDLVKKHPNWTLVDIYADDGISGTSLKKRDNFLRMIADCEAGKIDLIVVKNVSRFARNLVICLEYTRKLAALRPPVGVLFELEHIYTLNEHSEGALVGSAQFAEKESEWKSILLKHAYVTRSQYGTVYAPDLLGYDLDEDDKLVINEDEAQTVRLIFFMYLLGYTCTQIANKLIELERWTGGRKKKSKEFNFEWTPSACIRVLQNERHCGEVLTQKSYTPDFREHKSVKNKGEMAQWRKRNHHEPIISREDFIAVQHLIANAKYGNKGILPQLKVIKDGALRGFVSLNPRWAGFKAADYRAASLSAYEGGVPPEKPTAVAVQSGAFDFRGCEVVRGQFFNTANKMGVTFSTESVFFSYGSVHKFSNTHYVEILINPIEQIMAVRPCTKDFRNAVKWARADDDRVIARPINGAAFLETVYEIFGWDTDCKYRIRGIRKQKDGDSVLVFDMKEVEIFIPPELVESHTEKTGGKKKVIAAVPQEHAHDFGLNYYRLLQSQELTSIYRDDKGGITDDGQPFGDDVWGITGEQELADNIITIENNIRQGATTDDGN